MTRLLISLAVACCFLIPAGAFAGNDAPKLYLEIWQFGEVPDPVPEYVCVHTTPVPPTGISCYSTKTQFNTAFVALHVGNLNQPVCPTTGIACRVPPQGGYLGVPFGMMATGQSVTFLSFTACPGFLKGPSAAGEPSACLASSTSKCHDWQDHLGYLQYFTTSSSPAATTFGVVNNADLNLFKVINCGNQYDEGTTVVGGAQWGGTQSITCAVTAVTPTTWGNIKSLFR